jgi:hypothetical protein
MSKLSDFLKENSLTAADVAKRSNAIEKFSVTERAQQVARSDARRNKKPYADVKAEKPAKYGVGVSERVVSLAVNGGKVTRISRKKITRAVASLLASKKKEAVDWRALFADVGSKKGKTTKAAS